MPFEFLSNSRFADLIEAVEIDGGAFQHRPNLYVKNDKVSDDDQRGTGHNDLIQSWADVTTGVFAGAGDDIIGFLPARAEIYAASMRNHSAEEPAPRGFSAQAGPVMTWASSWMKRVAAAIMTSTGAFSSKSPAAPAPIASIRPSRVGRVIADGMDGDDDLQGGKLSDVLLGGAGRDTMNGGAGDDLLGIDAADDPDQIDGGDGTDIVVVIDTPGVQFDLQAARVEAAIGNAGDDVFTVGNSGHGPNENAGEHPGNGGQGNQAATASQMSSQAQGVIIDGQGGHDQARGGQAGDVLIGGAGNDALTGAAGGDLIYGNEGADLIYGNQGADTAMGGQGNDMAYGGQGGDELHGNDGDDGLHGNRGNDLIYGNAGADAIYGNQGDDALFGGQDGDTVHGGQGADTLVGNDGDDLLDGDQGGDQVYGNAGADTLVGGQGTDALHGGQDGDLLQGGEGGDTLHGGLGDDTLEGGLGSDLYLQAPGDGADVIDDAGGGADVLRFADGVEADDIWFEEMGDDLKILLMDTGDSVIVTDWADADHRIENIELADGAVLAGTDIDGLVQAMAAFDPDTFATDGDGNPILPDEAAAAITTYWES